MEQCSLICAHINVANNDLPVGTVMEWFLISAPRLGNIGTDTRKTTHQKYRIFLPYSTRRSLTCFRVTTDPLEREGSRPLNSLCKCTRPSCHLKKSTYINFILVPFFDVGMEISILPCKIFKKMMMIETNEARQSDDRETNDTFTLIHS